MNTRSLFLSSVILASIISFIGCSKDVDTYQPTQEEKVANAEEKLGVKIDPDQDWNMTAKATASITVNGNYGEKYTVKIYSNDPLVDSVGYVLAMGDIVSGETFEASFEYASAESHLVVGVINRSGYTTYRSVPVVDGVMKAVFGENAAMARGPRKSQSEPSVPNITVTQEYISTYADDAVEVTKDNENHNYNNRYWVQGTPGTEGHYEEGTAWGWTWQGGTVGSTLEYGYGQDWFDESSVSEDDLEFWKTYVMPFKNGNWQFYDGATNQNDATFVLMDYLNNTGRSSWVNVWTVGTKGHYVEGTEGTEAHWEEDPDWVLHYLISGSWNNLISVLPSEGEYARSVYVTGTWTLPLNQEQRVGGGGVVIIADGGELVLPQGSKLSLVNQARLIVLPGGVISGTGTIEVTNGNDDAQENYNAGEITVGKFNNNYGKFYNYGMLRATQYVAEAGMSNFYNHGVVNINNGGYAGNYDHGGTYTTPNARIYNACQWYCERDMRAYIIEMTMGSYFYVGGELMTSEGNDGTNDPSYVALANGALMQVGSLWNNLTSWQGPTSGYAVCEFGDIAYLNWEPGAPTPKGYFINNIAVSIEDKTVLNHDNHTTTYAHFKFAVANAYGMTDEYNVYGQVAVGTGNTVLVEKGKADLVLDGSADFDLGESGCTPGYNGTPGGTEDKPAVWCYAFEDTPLGDYDMNDVVIKVSQNPDNFDLLDVTLCCTGASFDLKVWLGDDMIFNAAGGEVHKVLGEASGSLINTGHGPDVEPVTTTIYRPYNFSFADADFWIESPAVPAGVHITRNPGEEPHGVVIPQDWAWPLEYLSIKLAYPLFAEFAADASTTDENIQAWYKSPVVGRTYRKY